LEGLPEVLEGLQEVLDAPLEVLDVPREVLDGLPNKSPLLIATAPAIAKAAAPAVIPPIPKQLQAPILFLNGCW
jgi:hypothetical protein